MADNNIHRLSKLTRDEYDDIVTPSMNTVYFLTDSGEMYLGTKKIGSGFIWTDANNPKPDTGITGYFYIDRLSFDMYIWNENVYRWVYFGNAGNNAISVNKFYEFRQEMLDQINTIQAQIDDIKNNHLYTESRINFTTDQFIKIVDTDYYAVTITKTPAQAKLLVKSVFAHIEKDSKAFQIRYPDITETETTIVLQFTVPADGFCILS